MGKILVTGGAGYIGTHIVKELVKNGQEVVVLDNLSGGYLEPLNIIKNKIGHFDFVKGDLADKEKVQEIFNGYKIETVMHLAAIINAAESVEKPDLYHVENFVNGTNLVEAMLQVGVSKIVFSSTAAVYGNPCYSPIDENHPVNPINPYGKTKYDFEKYLNSCPNLKYVIFRYFNVGGADPEGLIGKSHLETGDLIENVLETALGQKDFFEIFGTDYSTPDGTAVRDMVHVQDIAAAHILAGNYLNRFNPKNEIFNLGSAKGFSVMEVLKTAEKITGKKIPFKKSARRKGDISISVATSQKAQEILEWQKDFSTIEEIISTDWQWRQKKSFGLQKGS